MCGIRIPCTECGYIYNNWMLWLLVTNMLKYLVTSLPSNLVILWYNVKYKWFQNRNFYMVHRSRYEGDLCRTVVLIFDKYFKSQAHWKTLLTALGDVNFVGHPGFYFGSDWKEAAQLLEFRTRLFTRRRSCMTYIHTWYIDESCLYPFLWAHSIFLEYSEHTYGVLFSKSSKSLVYMEIGANPLYVFIRYFLERSSLKLKRWNLMPKLQPIRSYIANLYYTDRW